MYITCSFLTSNLFSYMALYPLVYKTTGLADHRFMLGGFITRLDYNPTSYDIAL